LKSEETPEISADFENSSSLIRLTHVFSQVQMSGEQLFERRRRKGAVDLR